MKKIRNAAYQSQPCIQQAPTNFHQRDWDRQAQYIHSHPTALVFFGSRETLTELQLTGQPILIPSAADHPHIGEGDRRLEWEPEDSHDLCHKRGIGDEVNWTKNTDPSRLLEHRHVYLQNHIPEDTLALLQSEVSSLPYKCWDNIFNSERPFAGASSLLTENLFNRLS